MHPIHDLAPELFHMLFSVMPRPALIACASTCHLWREVALPHLFFSLICKGHGRDLHNVLHFLKDAPTGVRRYIKVVVLGQGGNKNIQWLGHKLLADIIRLLPALAVLRIEQMILTELNDGARRPGELETNSTLPGSVPRKIQALDVYRCNFAEGNDRLRLLLSLLDPTILRVSESARWESWMPMNLTSLHTPRIEEISIGPFRADAEIATPVYASLPPGNLLTFSFIFQFDYPQKLQVMIKSLLRAHSSSIRCLRMNIYFIPTPS